MTVEIILYMKPVIQLLLNIFVKFCANVLSCYLILARLCDQKFTKNDKIR